MTNYLICLEKLESFCHLFSHYSFSYLCTAECEMYTHDNENYDVMTKFFLKNEKRIKLRGTYQNAVF